MRSMRRKVGGGGYKRWKRRTVNVRGRIKKAGWMNATDKRLLRGRMIEKPRGLEAA